MELAVCYFERRIDPARSLWNRHLGGERRLRGEHVPHASNPMNEHEEDAHKRYNSEPDLEILPSGDELDDSPETQQTHELEHTKELLVLREIASCHLLGQEHTDYQFKRNGRQ